MQQKFQQTNGCSINAASVSVGVNAFMLLAKLAAAILTKGSLAIISGTLDSLCDTISQIVNYYSRNRLDPEFPLGRHRLQSVGLIICSTINISVSSMNIMNIAKDLATDDRRETSDNLTGEAIAVIAILSFGMTIKFSLFLYCRMLENVLDRILAQDHFNDTCGNALVLSSWFLCRKYKSLWWADAVGGILISIFIIVTYFPNLVRGAHTAAGHRASEQATEKIDTIVKKAAERWKDSFEIERVVVTMDGDRLEVGIDIDVIDEENVSADLLIYVQLYIKDVLRQCDEFLIGDVHIHFEEDTESIRQSVESKDVLTLPLEIDASEQEI